MFAIAVPPQASKELHLMRYGTKRNQISAIFASGDALLMSTYRRISVANLVLTWRNVFSLDIRQGIRDGSSTTHSLSVPSSLKGQSLMNVTSFYPSTPSLTQCIILRTFHNSLGVEGHRKRGMYESFQTCMLDNIFRF